MNKKTFTHRVGASDVTLEITDLAEQADMSVIARAGDTVLLATATMSDRDVSANFFPLRVDFEERFYAGGKIMGSRFMRREGRPSDEATLTSRLIDRTIRPLFDQHMRRDVQVVVTVLSVDETNPADTLALIAASAALHLSSIPWNGPVGGIRVSDIGGTLTVNPNRDAFAEDRAMLSLVAAGPKDKINMIELAGLEVTEERVLEAADVAQAEINKIGDFLEQVRTEIGKPKREVALAGPSAEVLAAVAPHLAGLTSAVYQEAREEQYKAIEEVRVAVRGALEAAGSPISDNELEYIVDEELNRIVHQGILDNGKRPDGRQVKQLRPLEAEVGLLPRTHGSAWFRRGSTQSLAITTLGSPGDEQLSESIVDGDIKRRFMLHYNFPPYSTGEVGPFRSPGRREIGHGALAKKALDAVIPDSVTFPYTIRVVSEILSSNGSSSMASVCGATLSLMDAGVPIKAPVAGIAMGLATDDKNRFQVLTDLQGAEDHWGDMDFKVAGTRAGITAIQLDTKVPGLWRDIIVETLADAKVARMQILDLIEKTIAAPRSALSKYAPAIEQFAIKPEKIGMLIGPGGKTINGLIAEYGLGGINVEDDGSVSVSADSHEKVAAAVKVIKGMMHEYEAGEIIEGPITQLLDFGAIVDLGGGRDGMIHVSELKEGFVNHPSDVVKVGQTVKARVIRVENGKIGLSIKRLNNA
jgi:polyribonucleotide nucleotidyltransferase